jgi:hypothetical protein
MAGFGLPQADHFQKVSLMVLSPTKEPQEWPTAREITTGTILIRDNALLPKEWGFESEPCVPGWRLVKDLDGYGLDRRIQKAGWTFFCFVGEIKATVFGIDSQKMLRRAIECILAKGKSDGYNSLEITQVASVGSERFPLVRYVTVSAEWRHIQEGLFLDRGKVLPEVERKSASISRSTRIASDKALFLRKPPKQAAAVSILNP